MLEVSDKVKVTDDEYVECGKVKGKKRYVTEALESMREEIEEAEQALAGELIPFLRAMFRKFYDYRAIFTNAVTCISELDCLCALGDVSADDSFGPMSKPEILSSKPNGKPVLELHQMRHPCVQSVMKDSLKKKFIPNDVSLGTPS